MISITETTVTIAAIVFIVILIILAKLSRQIDDIANLLKQLRRKYTEQEEANKWNSDIIKTKLEKIEKKLTDKFNENEIPWGRGN